MAKEEVMAYIYYNTGERELHVFGPVCVAWNLNREGKRHGKPYIDFVIMHQTSGGDWYEDEDSPVEGGISLTTAKTVLYELGQAIEHLENIE